MGSGGGGGSGKIDYPEYLKAVHGDWLNDTGTDFIEKSVTLAMNSALGNSPYTALIAYDPDENISNVLSSMATFSALDLDTYLENALDSTLVPAVSMVSRYILSDEVIAARTLAFGTLLDDELDSTVLPRYKRGMQNINAVVSSAFVVGEALLHENRMHETAKFAADMNYAAFQQQNTLLVQLGEQSIKVAQIKLEYQKAVVGLVLDANKMAIISKKEELEQTLDIEGKEGLWDLEVYHYGAQVMAAIGGGVAQSVPHPNKAASALGGAMSGAAMGAQMGGMYGAAAGAVIGGIGGYLSAR